MGFILIRKNKSTFSGCRNYGKIKLLHVLPCTMSKLAVLSRFERLLEL